MLFPRILAIVSHSTESFPISKTVAENDLGRAADENLPISTRRVSEGSRYSWHSLAYASGYFFSAARLIGIVVGWMVWSMLDTAIADETDPLATAVAQRVRQLDANSAADRDAAEAELLELANAEDGRDRQSVFDLLPLVNPKMPPDLSHRLGRVRHSIATAIAEAAVAATIVSLEANNMPLSKVLAEIEKQTGNPIRGPGDEANEDQLDGQEATDPRLTLSIQEKPFWQALDLVLDQAELDVYNFSGEDAVKIVSREPSRIPRTVRATYGGPFRFAATELLGLRDLRNDNRKSLRVTLEIAWEPRLRPIRIALPTGQVVATDEDGKPIPVLDDESEFEATVQPGTQAEEIQIPFELPKRSVQSIASLRGKLSALVPGRRETFRFADLANDEPIEKRRAGVVVTLRTARKNNDLWDVHMRVRFDNPSEALASHFGWVLQNESYLEDGDGEIIDYVGLESTHQTADEIGFAYTFELPEGRKDLSGLTWVYKTPAAIVPMSIDFELKELPLP